MAELSDLLPFGYVRLVDEYQRKATILNIGNQIRFMGVDCRSVVLTVTDIDKKRVCVEDLDPLFKLALHRLIYKQRNVYAYEYPDNSLCMWHIRDDSELYENHRHSTDFSIYVAGKCDRFKEIYNESHERRKLIRNTLKEKLYSYNLGDGNLTKCIMGFLDRYTNEEVAEASEYTRSLCWYCPDKDAIIDDMVNKVRSYE